MYGDPADFAPIDHDGKLVSGIKACRGAIAGPFSPARGFTEQIKSSLSKVDDPINRNPRSRVEVPLGAAIFGVGPFGNLEYDCQVLGSRLVLSKSLERSANNGDIRSGTVVAPAQEGFFLSHVVTVWKEPAKFKDLQDKLMVETAKLETVAKTGDEAAFKAQVGATGKACGNCHDDFRAK